MTLYSPPCFNWKTNFNQAACEGTYAIQKIYMEDRMTQHSGGRYSTFLHKVWRLALEKTDKKMAQLCGWQICHLATWLLQPFVDHLNSLKPSIKFNMEREEDGTLPFSMCWLPIHITIQTTVYRKPTDTLTLPPLLPPRMHGIIYIMLHQSKRPYAWVQTQKDEVSHLTSNRMYSYPSDFIGKALRHSPNLSRLWPLICGRNWQYS